MNHFKLLFAGVMCMYSTIPLLRGQTASEQPSTLTVSYLTGSEVQYALSTIGKLSFSTDSVFLISTSNEVLGREAKEKVRAIIFTSETSTSVSMLDVDRVHVFPNPTADALQITGVETDTPLRIYSTDGHLLYSTFANEGITVLPVSQLQGGTYLLQINTQVVKFIKQ